MKNLSLPKQLENDKYEEFLEKLASEYADSCCDEAGPGSQFLSPGMQKAKYKEEFKSNVRLEEFEPHLIEAVSILVNEGSKYLQKEENEKLQAELGEAKRILSTLSFEDNQPELLYPVLGISDETLKAIDSIAREFYQLQAYEKSISLHILLIVLCATEANYWYHLGICFQALGNEDKALSAYACCHIIDPKNIGAYLFSAECYLKKKLFEDAKLELAEGEKLANELPNNTIWDKFIASLKQSLKN